MIQKYKILKVMRNNDLIRYMKRLVHIRRLKLDDKKFSGKMLPVTDLQRRENRLVVVCGEGKSIVYWPNDVSRRKAMFYACLGEPNEAIG